MGRQVAVMVYVVLMAAVVRGRAPSGPETSVQPDHLG
jgi:hypothetical protein